MQITQYQTTLMSDTVVLAYIRIHQLHMLCYEFTVYCILFIYISILIQYYVYNLTCKIFFITKYVFCQSLASPGPCGMHRTLYHIHNTLFMGGYKYRRERGHWAWGHLDILSRDPPEFLVTSLRVQNVVVVNRVSLVDFTHLVPLE